VQALDKADNEAADHGQLAPMARAAKEALEVEKLKAVADGGYYDNVTIAQCEASGVEACVPRPHKGSAASAGRFDKTQFSYDAATDSYTCPEGATHSTSLRAGFWKRKPSASSAGKSITFTPGRKPAAAACARVNAPRQTAGALSAGTAKRRSIACTRGWRRRLSGSRGARRSANIRHSTSLRPGFWHDQVLDEPARLPDAARPSTGLPIPHLLLGGLEKVRAGFSLSTLCYNLKRVLNILGVEKLLQALRKRMAAKKVALAAAADANDVLLPYLAFWRRRTSVIRANSLLPLPA